MPEQIRHDISKLSLFSNMLHDMAVHTEEQYQTFLEVQKRPHVLDNETVDRAIKAYQNQLQDLPLFKQQLTWWLEDALTETQRQQVDNLMAKLPVVKKQAVAILDLLAEIRQGTINQIMEMDDAELGLKFLLGQLGGLDED